MDLLHAVVLGVVQGLTEFLPVSSSGHLELVPRVFGWEQPAGSAGRAFDVALHFGTLCAVVGYFRHDLRRVVVAGLSPSAVRRRDQDARLGWLLVMSAIPAALAGVLLEGFIDERLGTPVVIGWSLVLFGVVLAVADRLLGVRRIESIGARDAAVIGVAQVLALNPGTSRSGVTMSAARALGIARDDAARFSFLMGIPVILGAFVFEMVGLASDGIPDGLGTAMIVGGVTAAVSGWCAVAGLLRFVRTRSFTPFVLYRIALGVIVLIVA
jgi:undecaprenyl-diphosphatase